MKLLEGDAALVTGAAHGIGRGIADALEQEGARVMRADVDGADLNFDLSHLGNAEKLAGEAIARLGKVSIFVHCASPRRGGSIRAGTPQHGEHSREILVELGFDDGEIADLVKHGILVQS